MKTTTKLHRVYALTLYMLSFLTFAQNAGQIDTTLLSSSSTNAGFNNAVRTVHILANQKIFVTGHFTQYFGINAPKMALLQPNGQLDTSFAINSLGAGGANHDVRSAFVDTNQFLYIGGLFTSVNGVSKNHLARLYPSGLLDTTFNSGIGPNNEVLKIMSNGNRVLIAGFFSSYNGTPAQNFAVLDNSGNIDSSFSLPGTMVMIRDFHLYPNNSMILVGTFTSPANRIVKLTPTGAIDPSFNSGTGANNVISTIKVQPDGKIMISGSFTSYNGIAVGGIARLNANGTIDPTFSSSPGFSASNSAAHIELQSDGKYILTGTSGIGTYNGVSTNFMIRLNANGSVDPSLNLGSGFNGSTNMSAVQNDGKILVAGGFLTYQGQNHRRLVRLMNNIGSIPSATLFAEFDLIIQNAPSGSPDSIFVQIDTFPLTPTQPAFSFYIPKINANTYYINQREAVYYSFLMGNMDVQISFACDTNWVSFIASYNNIAVNMSGPNVQDTTVHFIDTVNYCTSVPSQPANAFSISVIGTTNSAGGQSLVNNFTHLLLLARNSGGLISILDTLLEAANANDIRTFAITDTTLEYAILAIPTTQHAFLYANNAPTFTGHVSSWITAQWITVTGFVYDSIVLVNAQPGAGNGSGSGNVSSGTPRNMNGDPVEGLLMLITDSQGNLMNFGFTDALGDYYIADLDPGSYFLFGESVGRISDTVTLLISSSGQQQFSGLDFEMTDTQIVFKGSVAANTFFNAEHFRIFPNPSAGEITIDLNQLDEGNYNLEILSLSGRSLHQMMISSNQATRIDLSFLASGMYVVRLSNVQNNNNFTSRINKL
jgi:uncharacterized delta-60 repeat protein